MVKKMVMTPSLPRGFSLIELVVVIGLLALLMLAISGTMLMSVISSNRIRTATNIKQAGNYALGQIQTLVRNARSIESCSSNTLIIQNLDGGQTTFAVLDNHIASGSAYLTPDNLIVPFFNMTCEPAVSPSLVKISFDLQDSVTTLHFETSVSLRNQ
jgi:prepilin-type N-terminal cleavage/methylation domain-containing protein